MNKGLYIAIMVILFLSFLAAGIGWFNVRGDLRAAQIINEQLTARNTEYASALKEANDQVIMLNEQIQQAGTTIENLNRKLAEAKSYGSYWWQRAHPREFQSLDELKSWLAEDNTNAIHLISAEYAWQEPCSWVDPDYDCDDYAVDLMLNALADGYLISTQINSDHMLNSTIIGNNIYLIEPQTDEIKFWEYRD